MILSPVETCNGPMRLVDYSYYPAFILTSFSLPLRFLPSFSPAYNPSSLSPAPFPHHPSPLLPPSSCNHPFPYHPSPLSLTPPPPPPPPPPPTFPILLPSLQPFPCPFSQLSLFWSETHSFGANLTLSLQCLHFSLQCFHFSLYVAFSLSLFSYF